MKINEIIELVKAGYTKAEIEAFSENAEDEVVEAKPEQTKTEPLKQENVMFSALQAQIENLTKAVQAANIQNSTITTPNESADDVLAKILNPTKEVAK